MGAGVNQHFSLGRGNFLSHTPPARDESMGISNGGAERMLGEGAMGQGREGERRWGCWGRGQFRETERLS